MLSFIEPHNSLRRLRLTLPRDRIDDQAQTHPALPPFLYSRLTTALKRKIYIYIYHSFWLNSFDFRTKDKIAALEAKLRQMEQKPESSAPLTVLPSSLPQKPLVATMPTVPSGGVQRRPGASSSSSSTLAMRTTRSCTNLSTGSGLQLGRSSPSLPSSSTPASTSGKALRPVGSSSLPPKPGSSVGHRHSCSSLGIAIKR
jgi:hypothetical protein